YIIGSSFGERFLYTAVFGICVVVGYLCTLIASPEKSFSLKDFIFKNKNVLIPVFIVTVLFSVKTMARNEVWKSNYTLYSNDVLLAPNSTRTHYYLGNYLSKDVNLKGKTAKEIDSIQLVALAELKKSVDIYPFGDAYNQMGLIYNNLGSLYFNTGKVKEAQEMDEKAIKYNPNYPDAIMNLGSTYGMKQEYDTALSYFFKAIKLNPNLAQAYYYIGITYRYKGDEN